MGYSFIIEKKSDSQKLDVLQHPSFIHVSSKKRAILDGTNDVGTKFYETVNDELGFAKEITGKLKKLWVR